jgi:hypothetical protein
MEESTAESDLGPRAEKYDQQNADGNPGIDAEVKAGVGERKRCAG